MDCQSAMCFSSSWRGLGGKNVGRVLLRTFSNVLGPAERVGLWTNGFWGGCRSDCGADDDEGRDIAVNMAVEGEGDEVGVGVAVLLWGEGSTGRIEGVGRD